MSIARRKAGDLARESLAGGDPTGWFETLYRQAGGDPGGISWADLTPNPSLVAWLDREHVAGGGRRALKIGCGLGDDAEELARRGFVVTAFDVSPTAVEWCRRRFPGSVVRYQAADLLKPPPAFDRRFDFVLESYTLQVLPPDARAVAIGNVARFVARRIAADRARAGERRRYGDDAVAAPASRARWLRRRRPHRARVRRLPRRRDAAGAALPCPLPETMMATYEGGCHCGAVRFRATGTLDDVSDCNCSMCTKKGFLHWIIPPEQFTLLAGADALTTYQFNTKVARHTFCRHCGVHAFYTPRSDPDKVDVNVRCLDGVDLTTLRVRKFDGQNWEQAKGERDRPR